VQVCENISLSFSLSLFSGWHLRANEGQFLLHMPRLGFPEQGVGICGAAMFSDKNLAYSLLRCAMFCAAMSHHHGHSAVFLFFGGKLDTPHFTPQTKKYISPNFSLFFSTLLEKKIKNHG
jgi:hypothetical protein